MGAVKRNGHYAMRGIMDINSLLSLAAFGADELGVVLVADDGLDVASNSLASAGLTRCEIDSIINNSIPAEGIFTPVDESVLVEFASIGRATHGLRLKLVDSPENVLALLKYHGYSSAGCDAILKNCLPNNILS